MSIIIRGQTLEVWLSKLDPISRQVLKEEFERLYEIEKEYLKNK